MLSPVVLNPDGTAQVVPLRAAIDHLNGGVSLTGETRQDRINAQRRARYATDAEYRDAKKTAERDRKRTLWATSPEYRERRRARHRWRYANDPEYRERRRASRRAAYYKAKCRPSIYGLKGVQEGLV